MSRRADVAIDSAKMTTLDRKAAFFHVIDSHRWLAASGCAWNLVGANAASATKNPALQLMPNVNVMVCDCLLLHARSLIKFYRNINHGRTDIVLSDFRVPAIKHSLNRGLEDYEHSVEVHLLHLTDWRDAGYRKIHAKGKDATRDRRDWDKDAVSIVESILETLKWVSEQSGAWRTPFRDLHTASAARYRDKTYGWPTNLCEKSDVEQYLINLGL